MMREKRPPVDGAQPYAGYTVKLDGYTNYTLQRIRSVEPGVAEVSYTEEGESSAVTVRNLGERGMDLSIEDIPRWQFAKAFFGTLVADRALETELLRVLGEGRVFAAEDLPGGPGIRWRRST